LEGTGPPEEFEVVDGESKLTHSKYDGSLDSHVLLCNLLCSSSKSFFFSIFLLKSLFSDSGKKNHHSSKTGCVSTKKISRLEYKHDRDVPLIACFMWCKTGDPDNIA